MNGHLFSKDYKDVGTVLWQFRFLQLTEIMAMPVAWPPLQGSAIVAKLDLKCKVTQTHVDVSSIFLCKNVEPALKVGGAGINFHE